MKSTPEKPDSQKPTILTWVLTVIGVILLVRLGITLFNLVFGRNESHIASKIHDGTLLDKLLTPKGIVIQIVIIVAIGILAVLASKKQK